ncbi:unnamed protein product [Jaminaea pallidilutea]
MLSRIGPSGVECAHQRISFSTNHIAMSANKREIQMVSMTKSNFAEWSDVPKMQRKKKPNFRFSCFTNFAKSLVLQQLHTQAFLGKVLDLGCGRAAEINKVERYAALSYTGIDSSQVALRQATSRMKRAPKIPFKLVNWCIEEYLESSSLEDHFDTVISFNALHHIFWDKPRAAAALLRLGAVTSHRATFVGIIPNAAQIRTQASASLQQAAIGAQQKSTPTWCFSCDCTDAVSSCMCQRYKFDLEGSFKALEEPFVDWDVLESQLIAAGFEVAERISLSALLQSALASSEGQELWRAMHGELVPVLAPDEGALADMYTVFSVRKVARAT